MKIKCTDPETFVDSEVEFDDLQHELSEEINRHLTEYISKNKEKFASYISGVVPRPNKNEFGIALMSSKKQENGKYKKYAILVRTYDNEMDVVE